MSIRYVSRTVLRCKCVWCGKEWETLEKPKRCARCKRRTWNGEDQRRADPLEFVPPGSVLDGKPLQVSFRDLTATLMLARGIIAQLIVDFGPCNHPSGKVAKESESCVCHETEVMAKINTQIDLLQRVIGGRAERSKVTA